jgi:hypothetical protein
LIHDRRLEHIPTRGPAASWGAISFAVARYLMVLPVASAECGNDVLGEQLDLAHLLLPLHEALIEEKRTTFSQ